MESTGVVKAYDAEGDMTQRWFAFVMLPDAFGKHKRYKVYAPFRAGQTEAQRRAALEKIIQELQAKVDSGYNPFLEKRELDVIALMQDVARLKSRTLSKNWQKSYLVVIKLFADFCAKRKITQPTRSDVFDFRNRLLEKGSVKLKHLSNKSVNAYIGILSTLYEELVQVEKLAANPAKGIKPLPTELKGHNPYKDEHITAFLAYTKEHEPSLYVFVSFLYYTLNRPNALRNLRVGDVNLNNRTIRFESKFSKSRKVGFVLISDHFAELLAGMKLDSYPTNYYIFGETGQPDTRPRGVGYFYKANKRVLALLKIGNLGYTLYSWKHTGAIHLYNAIKDIKRVSDQCLHADVSITMRYLRGLGVIFGDDELIKKQPKLGG